MIFYLLNPQQTDDQISDNNILGEISFKSFHTGIAWNVLHNLITRGKKAVLERLIIRDSSGKIWEIGSFLSYLKDYHILKY